MEELQKKLLGILSKVNQSWEDKIKEAQDNDTQLELLGMTSAYSLRIEEMNSAFSDFRERMQKKNKKGWW